jgi:putative pre-16S rRNA nuclease
VPSAKCQVPSGVASGEVGTPSDVAAHSPGGGTSDDPTDFATTSHFPLHLALSTWHLALLPFVFVRLLGIDFGLRRIGLAVSDATGMLARPLRTLEREHGQSDADATDAVLHVIAELASDGDAVDGIVVGLPRRLDGSPSDQTAAVERFADRLRATTTLNVQLQDERLTSREAESRLALRERDWRKRKERLDAAAAAIILQDYLDAHAAVPAWHPDDTE